MYREGERARKLHVNDLPTEVLAAMLALFGPGSRDFAAVTTVCKRWRELAFDSVAALKLANRPGTAGAARKLGKGEALDTALASLLPYTQRLRELDIAWHSVSLRGLGAVARCGGLWTVNLTSCLALNDAMLEMICARNRGITRLVINGCTAVSDSGIRAALALLPLLEHLDVGGCTRLTDASLFEMASAPCAKRLRLLDVSGTATGCIGLTIASRSLPCLEHLSVLSLPSLCDADLAILSRMEGLRTLCLGYTGEVSDKGLCHLVGLQNLRALYVLHCPRVTDYVHELVCQLPLLRSVSFFGCTQITVRTQMEVQRTTHAPRRLADVQWQT